PVSPSRPAPTRAHTLSLHDALPICDAARGERANIVEIADAATGVERDALTDDGAHRVDEGKGRAREPVFRGEVDHIESTHAGEQDRKSTRLNSSHLGISYAVFCLKK